MATIAIINRSVLSTARLGPFLLGNKACQRSWLHTTSILAQERAYTKKHEWVCLKDDKKVGRVGVSNHAQEALGDVVYVQLPEVGSSHGQFEEIGAIESVKAASGLFTPVSGEIVGINSELEGEPGLINKDCYGKGWLYEIKLENVDELKTLMNEEEYENFLKTSEESI